MIYQCKFGKIPTIGFKKYGGYQNSALWLVPVMYPCQFGKIPPIDSRNMVNTIRDPKETNLSPLTFGGETWLD